MTSVNIMPNKEKIGICNFDNPAIIDNSDTEFAMVFIERDSLTKKLAI
jgi:hypothetical protein